MKSPNAAPKGRKGKLAGSQTPTTLVKPRCYFNHVDEVAYIAASYGRTLDPWAKTVIGAFAGETRAGLWAATVCGYSLPRQNGKTVGAAEPFTLYKMVVLGRKVLWTAHELKTVRKTFLRFKGWFGEDSPYPELRAMVTKIRESNGQEAIELSNGASIEFVARSRGSSRGFTVDDLVIDEAQELTDEQLAALRPTIRSAPSRNPQTIYLGTPPGQNAPGSVFPRMRATAMGKAKRRAWVDWSVSEIGDIRDRTRWEATNPALGLRITEETIEDDLSELSKDNFARECLGWWPPTLKNGKPRAIDLDQWRALTVADKPTAGRTCFAVKFSTDGAQVGLAAALRPPEGPIHVQALAVKPMAQGIDWLVDFLAPRATSAAQIVIDGKVGVGLLVAALREAGVRNKKVLIAPPDLPGVIAASTMFDQALGHEGLTHPPDRPEVTEELGKATKRTFKAGGFAWETTDGATTVLLDSMTLAHWACKTTKRRPAAKSTGVRVL